MYPTLRHRASPTRIYVTEPVPLRQYSINSYIHIHQSTHGGFEVWTLLTPILCLVKFGVVSCILCMRVTEEAARLCDSLEGIISVPYFVRGELTDKYFRRRCHCEEEDASPVIITMVMASVITMMDSGPTSKATREVKDWQWTAKLPDMRVEAISRQLTSVDVPVEACGRRGPVA